MSLVKSASFRKTIANECLGDRRNHRWFCGRTIDDSSLRGLSIYIELVCSALFIMEL